MRAALERALAVQPDMTLAGATGDGESAVALALVEPPDVILMDEGIPLRTGIQAARAMRRRGVQAPIVFLTADQTVSERARGISRSRVLVKGSVSLRETILSLRQAAGRD